MSESRQLALFDYGTLDLDTRSFVQTKTAEIRILVKQTAQGIIEIGQRLIEVKERLGHGEWLPWLDTEFGWSIRTAQYFIQIFEAFKNAHCAYLDNFGKTALKMLAYAPEPARTEALSLAESGEKITHQAAKDIIAKHKAEAEAAKKEAQTKQQTITTLEDQIKALEEERTRKQSLPLG